MPRQPPRSTRTATLFPYTTLCRSPPTRRRPPRSRTCSGGAPPKAPPARLRRRPHRKACIPVRSPLQTFLPSPRRSFTATGAHSVTKCDARQLTYPSTACLKLFDGWAKFSLAGGKLLRLVVAGGRRFAGRRRTGRLADSARRQRPETEHRSEEHTSELQSLNRNSYAIFCV